MKTMIGKARILTVSLAILLAMAVAPPIAHADPPPATEIEAIQEQIDLLIQVRRWYVGNQTAQVKAESVSERLGYLNVTLVLWDNILELGQTAVDMANEAYGTNVTGARFDPALQAEGVARSDGTILIGMRALTSPGWLASTKIHEGVHRQQFADADPTPDVTMCTVDRHQWEVEAYQAELAAADDTGLTQQERENIENRIAWHQAQLPD